MRKPWLIFASALVLSGVAVAIAAAQKPVQPVVTKVAAAPAKLTAVWQPPSGLTQEPIWPAAAPDMKDFPMPAEQVDTAVTPDALNGTTSQGVYNVSTPTMTIYPPKGSNTGVAIVVFPGGGFRMLAITLEGTEICDWLTAKGITCIVSKYRVPKTADYWDQDCKCQITPKVSRALQDAQRTIRLVRSRAKALGINPGKIGVMGFSAGGYLVAETSNIFTPSYAPVDAIDTVSSRPDFAVALYPGHMCKPGGKFDPGLTVTKQTPPTFLLQNWDDPVDDVCNSTLYARELDKAGVPSEVHFFAKGGHGFGLRNKSQRVAMWPSLVEGWMRERGIL